MTCPKLWGRSVCKRAVEDGYKSCLNNVRTLLKGTSEFENVCEHPSDLRTSKHASICEHPSLLQKYAGIQACEHASMRTYANIRACEQPSKSEHPSNLRLVTNHILFTRLRGQYDLLSKVWDAKQWKTWNPVLGPQFVNQLFEGHDSWSKICKRGGAHLHGVRYGHLLLKCFLGFVQ